MRHLGREYDPWTSEYHEVYTGNYAEMLNVARENDLKFCEVWTVKHHFYGPIGLDHNAPAKYCCRVLTS